ncbi:hypothetical protein EPT53_03350 [Fusobacterium necrophorum]|uniref:HutD family protein n=1 Tax=Fusobacterium necrophorum TaxID=859 RepID=A0A4Q2L119_9FUSO|nr:HutD family protein [Fusobacterium necrophorum]RXZ70540.1 hypothetical protein EPT53_03350 [Fusobacterium necrophorum]
MYTIIKKNEWKSLEWSGGITNQLYIYPKTADYARRDFSARISIAETKEAGRSQFTHLPGIDRFISNLEGNMQLEHEDHYTIDVHPYEIERFQGSWITFSTGKYRDFNLMLQGVMGDLYFKELTGDITLHLQEALTFAFVYVIEGSVILDGQVKLEASDLLIATNHKLDIKTNFAKIYYGFVKEWES